MSVLPPPAQERRKEEAARMALPELRNVLVRAEGLLGEHSDKLHPRGAKTGISPTLIKRPVERMTCV